MFILLKNELENIKVDARTIFGLHEDKKLLKNEIETMTKGLLNKSQKCYD